VLCLRCSLTRLWLYPGTFEHFGAFYRLLDSWKDPEFCCHGDGQILMQHVDCNLALRGTGQGQGWLPGGKDAQRLLTS